VIAEELPEGSRFQEAREIFERVALADDFVEFLTLPAYDYID
jgi:malate synthase